MAIKDTKVSQTISLGLSHIAKLQDLISRTGYDRSKLVQEAVDDLYTKYAGNVAESVGNPVNPHVAPTD